MKPRILILILGMLALGYGCVTAPAPGPAGAPPPAEAAAPTAAPPPSAVAAFTPTEALTPTAVVTSIPLPALPDVAQVLSFGGAGAGQCAEDQFPTEPNTIAPSLIDFGNAASFCATLRGGNLSAPFLVELVEPNGRVFQSPPLTYKPATDTVEWAGYPGFDERVRRTSDGTWFVTLGLWWPVTYPPGEWQLRMSGDGFAAYTNFRVDKQEGKPYIVAFDPLAETMIIPATVLGFHTPGGRPDGSLEVVGIEFPPRAPILVLVYRDSGELLEKRVAFADDSGSIRGRLPGPFDAGQRYYLIGWSDLNTPVNQETLSSSADYAMDWFAVMP